MNFYQTHVNQHNNLHVNYEPIITNQLKIDGFTGKTISRLKRDSMFKLIRLHNNIYVDHTLIDNLDVSFRFLLVYLLLQRKIRLKKKLNFALKTTFNVVAQTISNIFYGIGAAEREVYDLFGVSFKNHPDLRRVVTDYGFKGNPLKKDFPLTGTIEIFFSIIKKILIFRAIKFMQEIRIFHREAPWNDFIEDFFTSPKSEQEDDDEMIPIIAAFCLICGIFNLDWTNKNPTKGTWKSNFIQSKMEKPVSPMLTPKPVCPSPTPAPISNKRVGHTILDYYFEHKKKLIIQEIFEEKEILQEHVRSLAEKKSDLQADVASLETHKSDCLNSLDFFETKKSALQDNITALSQKESISANSVNNLVRYEEELNIKIQNGTNKRIELFNEKSALEQNIQQLVETKKTLKTDMKNEVVSDVFELMSSRKNGEDLKKLCETAENTLGYIYVNARKARFYNQTLTCYDLRSKEGFSGVTRNPEYEGFDHKKYHLIEKVFSKYNANDEVSLQKFIDWTFRNVDPDMYSSFLYMWKNTKKHAERPPAVEKLIERLRMLDERFQNGQVKTFPSFHEKYIELKGQIADIAFSQSSIDFIEKYLHIIESMWQ